MGQRQPSLKKKKKNLCPLKYQTVAYVMAGRGGKKYEESAWMVGGTYLLAEVKGSQQDFGRESRDS